MLVKLSGQDHGGKLLKKWKKKKKWLIQGVSGYGRSGKKLTRKPEIVFIFISLLLHYGILIKGNIYFNFSLSSQDLIQFMQHTLN